MTDTDIHSCGYYCDRHACIVAQRNELRDKLLAKKWVGLTDDEYEAMAELYVTNCYFDTLKYAHAIEQSLREKNRD
jgi:hypothetical protein